MTSLCGRGGRSRRDGVDNRRAALGRSTCGRISATHAGDGLARIPRVALDVDVVWYFAHRGPVGPHVFWVGALGPDVRLARRRLGREGLNRHALLLAMAVVGEVVLDGGLVLLAGHGGLSARGDVRHQAERRAGRENV